MLLGVFKSVSKTSDVIRGVKVPKSVYEEQLEIEKPFICRMVSPEDFTSWRSILVSNLEARSKNGNG